MTDEQLAGKSSAIHEIKKRIRISIAIVAFVVCTLFAVITHYLYHPTASYLHFLPDISISLILGISFVLALVGLFLSATMSRQVLRIINDYSTKLERILSITVDLREEIYGDILLEKILVNAMSITNADAGSILLLENDKLVFKIVKGEKAAQLIGTTLDRDKGISGWIAENAEPIRVQDVGSDPRFNADIDEFTGYTTKSFMGVPLLTRSGVIGVLELLNKRDGHPFRERDEEIITYLAGQAAISIIRTRFYEDQKNYEIHLTELLLEALDCHIVEKKGHSKRVARYSNIMAKGLNMTEEQKARLYHASLLHDVGFLKINTEDSFKKEAYMLHPVIGYEMIKPINFYANLAPIILYHHERYDGHGYPSKLQGEDIPLEARIIAIAEAFDAMISLTSYKVPMSFSEAVTELKHRAGSQFDRRLVEIFADNIDPQYIKD
ncbi:MAG: HD domain-containing protein [Nitrospirae bacterium]|nr:MAG: HD domain-containing protein [Nitrospirota bacterium]